MVLLLIGFCLLRKKKWRKLNVREFGIATEFAGRPLVVETGKMAQLANGECLVRYGETVVHVAVTAAAKPREGVDFFPVVRTLRRSCIPWARSPAPS